MMTLDELKQSLPATLRSAASQELLDRINLSITDDTAAEIYKENLVDYVGVLRDGKYKASSYIEAVRYVTFKLLNNTNEQAYALTFPDKYQELVARGASSKDISAYVSAYNSGKLVTAILEQSLTPFWIVNQSARQQALNTQVELMLHAESEYVRTQAADSVLKHTEQPKAVGPLVNFDMRENSGMNELKSLLSELAAKQVNAIKSGVSTKEVAEQVIEAEFTDAD